MGAKLVKENRVLVIVLISLLIVGAVILTNFVSFLSIESTFISQLMDNQQIRTDYSASQIESHIDQIQEELTTLSKFPIMEALDVSKCTSNIEDVHQSSEGRMGSILRADQTGTIIECSSPDFSNYFGLNIKNKDYFIVPKETNEPFIASFGRQGTNQQIIVSAPLFETTEYTPYPNFVGEFKGVLLSIIELNELYNLYIHPLIDEQESFFLLVDLDSEETILKSRNIEDYSKIKDLLPISMDDEPTKVVNIKDYGKTIITSSNLFLGSEIWRLFVLTPVKSARGNVESVQKRHLFSLGFVVIVIIGVTILMINLYSSKEKVQLKLQKANVTLEKLGINIEVEKDKFSQADLVLEPKNLYLVKEDDENHAHELFISTLNRGFAGLGIVRDDPRQIKKKYNLQKTSFIWLSNTEVDGIPCETNIINLFQVTLEFVKKSEKSVVLLERLDYILSENKLEDTIKIIHALKDLALSYECIIILSLNPDLIEESTLKAIEAETIDLYGKHLRKKVELSDLEMNILKYVNEKNVTNKLASYKDITGNFRITKPTTRVRINKLQNLGLLQIEQKGRFKSLRITSVGRKIIG